MNTNPSTHMNKYEILHRLDGICADIMSCATMEELSILKEKASFIRRSISAGGECDSGSSITSRVETGPIPIGWGKGKDE